MFPLRRALFFVCIFVVFANIFSKFLRVLQRRAGVSVKPGLHGLRVTGNNLSRVANGEELTQFHGGWLSASGRSRYDRFAPLDVVCPYVRPESYLVLLGYLLRGP